MSDLSTPARVSKSAIIRFWRRLPILIRAIFTGFIVFGIGIGVWTLFLIVLPGVWSIVAMAVVLLLYWKYFSGSWWPKATTSFRRDHFRAQRLTTTVWVWSIVATVLFVVVVQSGFVLTFRLIDYPHDTLNSTFDFAAMPFWAAWLSIIMISLVAGICEEVGFRGYMQLPLEKRYGPKVAVVIVSLVFLVSHLNQAYAAPILFHIFAISLMLGVLAYSTDSLIPGIIGHAVMDIFNLSYWWSDVAGIFERRTILDTGVDSHFFIWMVLFVVSMVLFIVATRKTLALRHQTGIA